jgi:hypothetical protein
VEIKYMPPELHPENLASMLQNQHPEFKASEASLQIAVAEPDLSDVLFVKAALHLGDLSTAKELIFNEIAEARGWYSALWGPTVVRCCLTALQERPELHVASAITLVAFANLTGRRIQLRTARWDDLGHLQRADLPSLISGVSSQLLDFADDEKDGIRDWFQLPTRLPHLEDDESDPLRLLGHGNCFVWEDVPERVELRREPFPSALPAPQPFAAQLFPSFKSTDAVPKPAHDEEGFLDSLAQEWESNPAPRPKGTSGAKVRPSTLKRTSVSVQEYLVLGFESRPDPEGGSSVEPRLETYYGGSETAGGWSLDTVRTSLQTLIRHEVAELKLSNLYDIDAVWICSTLQRISVDRSASSLNSGIVDLWLQPVQSPHHRLPVRSGLRIAGPDGKLRQAHMHYNFKVGIFHSPLAKFDIYVILPTHDKDKLEKFWVELGAAIASNESVHHDLKDKAKQQSFGKAAAAVNKVGISFPLFCKVPVRLCRCDCCCCRCLIFLAGCNFCWSVLTVFHDFFS